MPELKLPLLEYSAKQRPSLRQTMPVSRPSAGLRGCLPAELAAPRDSALRSGDSDWLHALPGRRRPNCRVLLRQHRTPDAAPAKSKPQTADSNERVATSVKSETSIAVLARRYLALAFTCRRTLMTKLGVKLRCASFAFVIGLTCTIHSG